MQKPSAPQASSLPSHQDTPLGGASHRLPNRVLLEALLVLTISGVAAWLGWREPFAFTFGNDAKLERIYTKGFYASELTPQRVGGAWSRDGALILLPFSEAGGRLTVTLAAPRNPGQPPPTIYLNLDGTTPLDTLHPDTSLRDYTVDLPETLPTDHYLYINSETFTPSDDSRSLGVFITSVRTDASPLSLMLLRIPPVMFIALAAWGLGRRLGGRWLGFAAGLGMAMLLGLGLAFARMEIAPYLLGWLFALGGGWLLLTLADKFAARLGGGVLVPLTYAGFGFALLPVLQVVWNKIYISDVLNGRAATLPTGVLLYTSLIAALLLTIAYFRWRNDAAKLRRATLVIFLAVAAAYFIAAQAYVFSHNLYGGIDLKQDYDALLNWQAGGSPYNLEDALQHPGTAVKLPPLFGYFLLPQIWAGADFPSVLLWWRIGNLLLYALAVYVTLRAFDLPLRSETSGSVIWLALMSGQVAETLAWGQFNIILLLGIALALWLIRQQRLAWAGAALSLPVMLKFFPATLAFPFAFTRRGWRGISGLAAGFIALALLPIPLLGWDTVSFYWTQIFPSIGGGADEGVSNQSIYALVARLAVPEVTLEHRPPGAGWVLPIAYALIALLIAATVWLVWRWQSRYNNAAPNHPTSQLLPYLLSLALGLLIIPFAWQHYEVVLLPAFVGTMLWLVQGPANLQSAICNLQSPMFGLTFALIGFGGRFDFVGNYAVGLDRVGASYHGLAVLLLWGLLAYIVWQRGEQRFAPTN